MAKLKQARKTDHYIRCLYCERPPAQVYPYERFVIFRTGDNAAVRMIVNGKSFPRDNENWIIVPRKYVIDDEERVEARENRQGYELKPGLVKVTIGRMKEQNDRARIGIYNSPDGRVDRFWVRLDDVVIR